MEQIDVSELRKRTSAVLIHSRNKPDIPATRQDEIARTEGKPPSVFEIALIADAAGVDSWWIINGDRMPDVVDQSPLNVDILRPEPMGREEALKWVIENKDSSLSRIWAHVVAPLYDRLEYEFNYRNGYCRFCQMLHPRVWEEKHPGVPWVGHTMSCPKYTGPVEHRRTRFEETKTGFRLRCTCGHKWNAKELTDETKKCPNIEEIHRGPQKVIHEQ